MNGNIIQDLVVQSSEEILRQVLATAVFLIVSIFGQRPWPFCTDAIGSEILEGDAADTVAFASPDIKPTGKCAVYGFGLDQLFY